MALAQKELKEIVGEKDVVALEIMHHAAHPGKALTKPEVVSRVVLRRLSFRPIPISAILQIDDIDLVIPDDFPASLQAQIVNAAKALFKDLRRHNSGAHREDHTAV